MDYLDLYFSPSSRSLALQEPRGAMFHSTTPPARPDGRTRCGVGCYQQPQVDSEIDGETSFNQRFSRRCREATEPIFRSINITRYCSSGLCFRFRQFLNHSLLYPIRIVKQRYNLVSTSFNKASSTSLVKEEVTFCVALDPCDTRHASDPVST